jgi:hypothetical protein
VRNVAEVIRAFAGVVALIAMKKTEIDRRRAAGKGKTA